jgi:hypothetical protein
MPKIGDLKCMNYKDLWGIWDGNFWCRVDETADGLSYIISKETLERMMHNLLLEGFR